MTETMILYKSLLFALMSAAFVAGQQGIGQDCFSDGDCPGSQVCCLGILVGGGGGCIEQSACSNG